MSPGIRATVEFDSPAVCPLAALSAEFDATIRSVATSVSTADGTASATEFHVAADAPIEDDRLTHVISYGSTDVYRMDHDDPWGCPCECLGAQGCPVEQYVASDGTLRLVFHAPDFDRLQALVTALRDRYPGVDITRLVREPDGESPPDEVRVDRGRLTDRQFQVLETAFEMGYFERPRRANATEIATELGINRATFAEHMTAAQRKLLEDVFA